MPWSLSWAISALCVLASPSCIFRLFIPSMPWEGTGVFSSRLSGHVTWTFLAVIDPEKNDVSHLVS